MNVLAVSTVGAIVDGNICLWFRSYDCFGTDTGFKSNVMHLITIRYPSGYVYKIGYHFRVVYDDRRPSM